MKTLSLTAFLVFSENAFVDSVFAQCWSTTQHPSPFGCKNVVIDSVFTISLFLQSFLPHTYYSKYFTKKDQIKKKFVHRAIKRDLHVAFIDLENIVMFNNTTPILFLQVWEKTLLSASIIHTSILIKIYLTQPTKTTPILFLQVTKCFSNHFSLQIVMTFASRRKIRNVY